MYDHPAETPHVSLCTGYAGIDLGLKRACPSIRTVAYVEREAYACANLVAKIEEGRLDWAPIFTDITSFPWREFRPLMGRGILSFGWPCQPVSCAGQRKATEDERWLFDIITDGIAVMRPGVLFAENVEGLLSAKMPDGGSVFAHCVTRLESLHYRFEVGLFSAVEVGASHRRKRVFILAVLADSGCLPPAWLDGALHDERSEGRESLEVRGPELADADRARLDQHGERNGRPLESELGASLGNDAARRHEGMAEPVGVALGDANGTGCEQQRRPEPIRAQQPSAERAGGRVLDDLAHAIDRGSQVRRPGGAGEVRDERGDAVRSAASESGGEMCFALPRFPPGPGLGGAGVLNDVQRIYDRSPAEAWPRFREELANTLRWGAILAVRLDLAPAVEPPLRGVADGLPGELVSTRVDELRIGGNGVVIATVERAFRVLASRFHEACEDVSDVRSPSGV